jgi:hypothetical protein
LLFRQTNHCGDLFQRLDHCDWASCFEWCLSKPNFCTQLWATVRYLLIIFPSSLLFWFFFFCILFAFFLLSFFLLFLFCLSSLFLPSFCPLLPLTYPLSHILSTQIYNIYIFSSFCISLYTLLIFSLFSALYFPYFSSSTYVLPFSFLFLPSVASLTPSYSHVAFSLHYLFPLFQSI